MNWRDEAREVAMRDLRSYPALGSGNVPYSIPTTAMADAEIDARYQECNSAETTARDPNFPIEKRRLAS
jgi:hypothetical protein